MNLAEWEKIIEWTKRVEELVTKFDQINHAQMNDEARVGDAIHLMCELQKLLDEL